MRLEIEISERSAELFYSIFASTARSVGKGNFVDWIYLSREDQEFWRMYSRKLMQSYIGAANYKSPVL